MPKHNIIINTLVFLLVSFSVQVGCFDITSNKALTNIQNDIEHYPTVLVGKTSENFYYVNVSFGDPEQTQILALDTASPYTWVLSASQGSQCSNISICDYSASFYLVEDSETAVEVNVDRTYALQFIEGTSVNGTAVSDIITFNNITSVGNSASSSFKYSIQNDTRNVTYTNENLTISKLSFINANQSSNLYSGVLGLGGLITYPNKEIDKSNFDESFYFMSALKDANLIDSVSYSLWLYNQSTQQIIGSKSNDSCGRLIFGAVDPSLYKGALYQFDMIPYIDPETGVSSTGYPILPMGPIYITSSGGTTLNMTSKQFLEPVLIDSSFKDSYLPASAIIQIAIQIGATYVQSLDKWLVPCDIATLGAHIDFTFAEAKIKVPVANLLTKSLDSTTNETMHFSNGQDACFLKLYANAYIGFNVLGESFLRNAYFVVDIEGNTVALAQAQNPVYHSVSVRKTTKVSSSVSSKTTTAIKSSSSSTSSVRTVAAIQSGYIPYATYRNYTSTTIVLYPSSVPYLISNIPDQYTASIYSDGIITGFGRSFYDTSRTSTTTTSSSTQFTSLSVDLGRAANTTTMSAGANNRPDIPVVYRFMDMESCVLFTTVLAFFSLNLLL